MRGVATRLPEFFGGRPRGLFPELSTGFEADITDLDENAILSVGGVSSWESIAVN